MLILLINICASGLQAGEKKSGKADFTSKLETQRNIDARQLNFKYGVMAVLTLAVSILAAFLFQYPQGQFW